MASDPGFTDTYRHRGLRKKLVSVIRSKGIQDQAILDVIGKIPRHFFLDRAFEDWAYKDQAFPIASKQTISQPYTVAYQTQLLCLEPKDRVLEIGTGSGYQAAVLSELCAKVYSVERQGTLYTKTKKLLQRLGYGNIRLYHMDGMLGLSRYAPFDKILVTAGADQTPQALLDQLKIGGYLVIPVGDRKGQVMLRIEKVSEKEYRTERFDNFRFVPLLDGLK
ncbi:MAG: protein-L-isoaspartate(D-aspartate) O-methyltransferase [Saprospiraceae bacterium]|nr:protein-L-isoaspartate(D-aspartate) O-methyltransferase [Saprospiraceae bacterium]